MFTGIIQAVATIDSVQDHNGLRTFEIEFPHGFCEDLAIGASVAVDGVCLTVTSLLSATRASFDVMLQSLRITTLSQFSKGSRVNVERAAKDGAEIGGHPLSGHVDFAADVRDIAEMEGNYRVRISMDGEWKRYIFPKGYIAINGASLTIAEVNRQEGWFDVWLIPETRRMTTFETKRVGDLLNIEIERGTQVVVDTVRTTLEENLGQLYPLLEALLSQQGHNLEQLTVGDIPAITKAIQGK